MVMYFNEKLKYLNLRENNFDNSVISLVDPIMKKTSGMTINFSGNKQKFKDSEVSLLKNKYDKKVLFN